MLAIGICTGILSGIFGIGGGVVLVPLLILFLGYEQHVASGTSLVALLLPVGLLGAIEYYRAGKLTPENVKFGFIIALGLFVGTFFGARIAVHLPADTLRRSFAVFLVLVAAKLWLST